MSISRFRCAFLILASTAAMSAAQWVGPSAPDNRMKYETGPVYLGVTALTSARLGVIEPATGTRHRLVCIRRHTRERQPHHGHLGRNQ